MGDRITKKIELLLRAMQIGNRLKVLFSPFFEMDTISKIYN
jgi:hypothetical protein